VTWWLALLGLWFLVAVLAAAIFRQMVRNGDEGDDDAA
jgi:hypothetical protein